jgi:hypothetical protein
MSPMSLKPEDGVELAPESTETCDGCGEHVRAIWLVEVAGSVLTFCGDHYRRYLSSLAT